MNIRNITPKERMLKNIRQALLEKRDNPQPDFVDSPLYQEEEESLDVTFAREFTAVSGKFIYCDSEISIIENLIALVEDLKLTKVYAWEKNIQDLLGHYGFPCFTGTNSFEDAEVGITTCEALIARNGSILLSNATASGRRLSVYPPVHIVLAKASQLVMDIKYGMSLMKKRYGNDMPSIVSVVTGPSRTADIEKRLVLGAHGPKELYVFLIEDRF